MQPSKNRFVSAWQTLFGDPVRAFGVVSLLLVIVLGIAPAKNHFSEWRHYQKGYLRLIHGRGDANHVAASLPPRNPTDLAAGSWGSGPMHNLPRRPEGSEPGGRDYATLYPASCDSPLGGPVWMRFVPSRAGRGNHCRRCHHSTSGREQPVLPARYVRVVLRAVPSCSTYWNSAVERRPQHAFAQRLCATVTLSSCPTAAR